LEASISNSGATTIFLAWPSMIHADEVEASLNAAEVPSQFKAAEFAGISNFAATAGHAQSRALVEN